MSPRFIARSLLATIIALWIPTLAGAAALAITHAGEPLAMDPMLIAYSLLLATMGGGSTLAIRLNLLILNDPGKPLTRPGLFCLAHMAGSWCAGTAGFLVGRQQAWDVWTSLIFVFVLAFAGAKGMEILVEKYLGVFRPKL